MPATFYFPVLPANAFSSAKPQLVPLAASGPLDGSHPGVTRAIIIIHDESRDAPAALATVAALAGSLNSSLILLAPQFLLPSDVVRFADHLPSKGQNFAAWQVLNWVDGSPSMPIPHHRSLSSFTVVDLLLMAVTDRSFFPDLDSVVVAGFGTGANFVQRYAFFSSAADVLTSQGFDLRFVVADATSYLYPTAVRPLGGKRGFGMIDPASCPAFQDYPYGLRKLNPYAKRVGANAAKLNYGLRHVFYLNAPTADPLPATLCPAMLQGSNGAMRADNYKLYLRSLYGSLAEQNHVFFKTVGGVNDAVSLFGSACGMTALFGNGSCSPPIRFGL
ncbi:MAG: hypothetical protein PHS57_10125 [Alphaproteobacteria bacterium]|nr:hypothetical protein [Alphaproteobacteria bacterium]